MLGGLAILGSVRLREDVDQERLMRVVCFSRNITKESKNHNTMREITQVFPSHSLKRKNYPHLNKNVNTGAGECYHVLAQIVAHDLER